KRFLIFIGVIFSFSVTWAQSYPPVVSSPSTGQNYRLTRIFKVPVLPAGLGTVRTVNQENQQVVYFDGLGRVSQEILVQGSPGFQDVVKFYQYGGFGLQERQYAPYATLGGGNGSFKSNAASDQLAYYGASSWDSQVKKTAYPFSQTVYELSSLHRVREQGFAGYAWQPSSSRGLTGRTQVFEQASNYASDVRIWVVGTNGASSSGFYAAGS